MCPDAQPVARSISYEDWLSDPTLGYATALYVETWRGGESGRLFFDRHDLARALLEDGPSDVLVAHVPVEFVPCRLLPMPLGVAVAALESLSRDGAAPSAAEFSALRSALESWWERHAGPRAYHVDFSARVRLTPSVRERIACDAQRALYERRAATGRYDSGCYVEDCAW